MWIKNEVYLPPCVSRRDMGVAPDGGVWACVQPSHFIRGGKFLRCPMIWRVDGQRLGLMLWNGGISLYHGSPARYNWKCSDFCGIYLPP